MRVVYSLFIKENKKVSIPEGTLPTEIYGINIYWESVNGNLSCVKLEAKGLNVRKNSSNVILPGSYALENEAFRIASYLSNIILIQTAVDCIDPADIIHNSPEIFPNFPIPGLSSFLWIFDQFYSGCHINAEREIFIKQVESLFYSFCLVKFLFRIRNFWFQKGGKL